MIILDIAFFFAEPHAAAGLIGAPLYTMYSEIKTQLGGAFVVRVWSARRPV